MLHYIFRYLLSFRYYIYLYFAPKYAAYLRYKYTIKYLYSNKYFKIFFILLNYLYLQIVKFCFCPVSFVYIITLYAFCLCFFSNISSSLIMASCCVVSIIRAYTCVVFTFVCPHSFDTTYIFTSAAMLNVTNVTLDT